MRLIRLIALARRLQKLADEGRELIDVPGWLVPELRQLIWQRNVERAETKWARKTAEVSLSEWQAAAEAAAERRRPRD